MADNATGIAPKGEATVPVTHLHRARFDRKTSAFWILCLGDVPTDTQTVRAVHDRWTDRDQVGSWPGCPLRGEHEPVEIVPLAGGHFEPAAEREASEQEAAGLAEYHEHYDQPCEFPTCAGCGGCTEDGGHRHAGRAYCGNCGEKRVLEAAQ
jgi:hypothetical protein